MLTDTDVNNQLKADLVAFGTNWRSVDVEADVSEWIAGPAGDTYRNLCKWSFDDTPPTPRHVVGAALASTFGVEKRPHGPWLLSGVIKRN